MLNGQRDYLDPKYLFLLKARRRVKLGGGKNGRQRDSSGDSPPWFGTESEFLLHAGYLCCITFHYAVLFIETTVIGVGGRTLLPSFFVSRWSRRRAILIFNLHRFLRPIYREIDHSHCSRLRWLFTTIVKMYFSLRRRVSNILDAR